VVKFKKPPVVEVWIAFDFDPNERKREWDIDLVQQYVQRHASELPKMEMTHEKELQFQETSPTSLPKVISQRLQLKQVRIFNDDKTRVLQIGDDQISYHLVASPKGYPGYDQVREETIGKLRDYLELFHPTAIRSAAIHYVDIIDIPRPPDGKIDVRDYFVAYADLPEEPFGTVADVVARFVVVCPSDKGPMVLQIKTVTAPTESNVIRFRMDWHKQCTDINSLDLAEVCRRLDVAHEYLSQCFLASLDQRTLALFDPSDEDGHASCS
jgi:uncharacterized protein (TIGR04255 family)